MRLIGQLSMRWSGSGQFVAHQNVVFGIIPDKSSFPAATEFLKPLQDFGMKALQLADAETMRIALRQEDQSLR